MTKIFTGNTADSAWLNAFSELKNSNEAIRQNSRLGMSHEILHACFHIFDPRQRWVTSRCPAINPAFGIVEAFWILSGLNDAYLLNFWNPILPRFAGNSSTYHGAYGHRIRKGFGFDQLDRAYNALKKNPSSRQIVIQIWNPFLDFPNHHGEPVDPDIPCNLCSIPKIRNNKLEWLQIMRSNDLYRGTPYNFIQFTTIQEVLSGWLEIELGSYFHISDSLHIYDSDMDSLEANSSSSLTNSDSLAIPKVKFDHILTIIIESLYELAASNLTTSSFNSIIDAHLPESYRNLLLIAAADSARRRSWREQMLLAESLCSNAQLLFIWEKWKNRWAST